MMIKNIINTVFFELFCHHINIIRRIAAMNHIKADFFINLLSQAVFFFKCRSIFFQVADRTIPLFGQIMPENMDTADTFIFRHVTSAFWTNN
ncbi:hypothetical protein SDC9_177114 [bioreactor metagenome]|uniref:Uncharacterized protein n=1 Tax=bioreactor metagenome TaxID=1076179 RepID=A0A645GS32_9ZZZZ